MHGAYYINDDRQEYCSLPDPTQHQQVAIVGYLLFQGTMDGTSYTSFPDPEEFDLSEKKADERRSEGRLFERYVREMPDYIVNRFERETFERVGDFDYSQLDEYREFCAQQARSTYRNEDDSWDERSLARIVASKLEFDEYFDYLGRWSEDDVRLAVDPDDLAAYDELTDDVVHEMHRTVPDDFLANGEEVLTPDFVVTSSDDGGGGGDEPEANNSGDSEKKLFPDA